MVSDEYVPKCATTQTRWPLAGAGTTSGGPSKSSWTVSMGSTVNLVRTVIVQPDPPHAAEPDVRTDAVNVTMPIGALDARVATWTSVIAMRFG